MGILSKWIRGCGTITEEAAESAALLLLLFPTACSLLCLVSQLGWWLFIPYTIKPFVLQAFFMMEFLHLQASN